MFRVRFEEIDLPAAGPWCATQGPWGTRSDRSRAAIARASWALVWATRQ